MPKKHKSERYGKRILSFRSHKREPIFMRLRTIRWIGTNLFRFSTFYRGTSAYFLNKTTAMIRPGDAFLLNRSSCHQFLS